LFSNIAKVSIYSNDLIIPSSFWDILSKTNLAIVEITSKKDIDISGLLKLKHLTHLELSAPHIINQDQITELTNLKVLKITETDIQDLRFLEKIPQLSELYLGNFWGVSNKEPKKYTNFHYLEKLPFLESLDLSNSNFSELKYLTKLPKLQQLIVNNCPIVDYKNIQNFKKPLSISCDGLFFEKTIDFVKKSKVQHNYGALSGLSETQKKQYDEWIISKDKED
jgi:internalin A